MQKVRFDQVRKSYNGKTGCMCGCLGSYTLPSHTCVADANKAAGWDAYDQSDVSDRRVKVALAKVNKAIDQFGALAVDNGQGCMQYSGRDADDKFVWFGMTDHWVSINRGDRSTTVYLKD